MTDELPTALCPNCGAETLTPVDDMFTEIERRVFEDSELWACPCGVQREPARPDDYA